MQRVERIRQFARVSVGRGCMFAMLAVATTSGALITWPSLAMKTAAVLTSIVWAALILKPLRAPKTNYRRTETWALLGKQHGFPEPHAQRIISSVLAETYWRFADYAAVLALLFWFASGVFWLGGR